MIKPIGPIAEAQLKAEMRDMYRKIGFAGSMQCLYEIITSAVILTDVMKEEISNETNEEEKRMDI